MIWFAYAGKIPPRVRPRIILPKTQCAQLHVPHLQVAASRPSEFLTSDPIGDGITRSGKKRFQ